MIDGRNIHLDARSAGGRCLNIPSKCRLVGHQADISTSMRGPQQARQRVGPNKNMPTWLAMCTTRVETGMCHFVHL